MRSIKRAVISRRRGRIGSQEFWLAYEARIQAGIIAPDYPFLERLVQGSSCIFDIGANVGRTALLFASSAGAGATVFAFEPSEAACLVIRENAILNDLGGIAIVNALVSAKSGEVADFHWDFISPNSSMFGRTPSNMSLLLKKATLSIDDFVGATGLKPDVVKIDVEGAEAGVVSGMRETLRNCRPTVYVELHGWSGMHVGSVAEAILAIARLSGYQMIDLDTKKCVQDGKVFSKHGDVAEVQAQDRVILVPDNVEGLQWLAEFDTSLL
jgi:FkbM family methyltransferase